MIKAFLCDFDGTLVNRDILTYVSEIVGKEKESKKINDDFIKGKRHGLEGLVQRINFLADTKIEEINKKLEEEDFLEPVAKDMFNYLNGKGIISIINSGNIFPIVEYYKEKVNADYIVASKPSGENGLVGKIKESDCIGSEIKLYRMKDVLAKLNINKDEVIAIGDSIADKAAFEYAKYSIAVNAKGGIHKYADYSVNNLEEAWEIIKKIVEKEEKVNFSEVP